MLYINLLIGLVIILISAELFTNGVEWLGVKLGLSEGAVGNVLAAVGTALPESIIPIVAIFFNTGVDTEHIGIGAILGAPFMLGTLAFFITGLCTKLFVWRGPSGKILHVDNHLIIKDLVFFIFLYSLAIGASFTNIKFIHYTIVAILLVAYFSYVVITIKSGEGMGHSDLGPLYGCFWRKEPKLIFVVLQVLFSLIMIVIGAEFFVGGIKFLAGQIGIPSLVLALVIAPVATELPEKFNSIIWIGQRKDTLALGNITGAMVFQSSIIPAFGILATPWQLNGISLLSGLLVLFSALILLVNVLRTKELRADFLMFCGLFYLIFIGVVCWAMN